MKRIVLSFLAFTSLTVYAQDAIEYKTPPAAISELILAKLTPAVSIDGKGHWMLLMERSSMPSLEDLAQPELRIAGMRINPNNFAASRATYFTGFTLKDIRTGQEYTIKGLPQNMKASNVDWSPDESTIAFTNATANTVDLYSINVASKTAMKINKQPLNTLLGSAYNWVDAHTILYKATLKPASAAPKNPLAPKGPTVQQNLGKVAASVTYQDLIKSPSDEAQFEFYANAQLVKNHKGVETKLGAPAIFSSIEVSPDKKYLLIEKIDKPFSYLVPAGGFNSSIYITTIDGKPVKEIVKLPSAELAPRGNDNVLNAPRGHRWLNNQPASITWIEPLDSGLIKNKMDYHDAAFLLAAPFSGAPKPLVKTAMRMGNVNDVNDSIYLVTEYSRAKHRTKTNKLNPLTGSFETIIDRSTDDAYADPGTPITDKNKFGVNSIRLVKGNKMLMRGNGSSAKGDYPFLATFDLQSKQSEIIWKSADPYYESVATVTDFDQPEFVTVQQSQQLPSNYFLKNLKTNSSKKITSFPDPQPALRNISKQKITYKRQDGVDLAADLYLPENYDPKKDGRLPVLMWAYPREFKSASDAAQVRGSNNTFTRVGWSSPIFWVTQGYAVMDNTEFPIVGEGDKQPNDNFIDQLTWNAKAAIDKISAMGIGDSNRVAVGGHSYGAFMTANLLAHTSLFKAGIARSGAYNRTLTPFGFQNEERTYWQSPEVYFNMSPFSYADKIKTPLLMIHGEADNNPGTFPIQSERLYNAIKGHGGTVRYVQLPFESHSYASKENVLHMLWEMNEWLSKYVK